jgi:uncharacterized protein with FMN-binding domain
MRRTAAGVLSTAGVLAVLIGYPTSTDPWAGTPSAGTTAPRTPAAERERSSSPRTHHARPRPTRTYLGDAVRTKRGYVQVELTVVGRRIVAARALRHPGQNGRDLAINARALPILDAAVVRRQGVDVDHVSGATVTSAGYLASLQSALDRAHR